MDFHNVNENTILCLKNASTAILAKQYFKLHIKQRTASQNIWFNQQCLKKKLIPSYINVRINSSSIASKKALQAAQTVWLKEETRFWFNRRNICRIYLKIIHTELTYNLHPVEFDLLDDKTRETVSVLIHNKYMKQQNKIKFLESRRNMKKDNNGNFGNNNKMNIINSEMDRIYHDDTCLPGKKFGDRLINYSMVTFNENELKLLNKGIKYTPFNKNPKYKEILISEVETALKHVQNVDFLKHKIVKIIKDIPILGNNKDNSILTGLKNKINSNNLIITKADKSNSIVILNKKDYFEKIDNFINNNNMIILKKDPTNNLQKDLINVLKNNNALTDFEKFNVKCMNPKAPRLYGLIKNHKPDRPIRPVVSFTNSVTWKLAKKINSMIRNVTKFKSENSVKNSVELTNFLKSINSNQKIILVSFDICSMFSNIPPKECLMFVKNLLFQSNVNSNLSTDILSLLNFCLSKNYFQFDNKFYEQNSGLAMGCPLSPLLAEIFMNNMENKILDNILSHNHIMFWKRYVDDILAGFIGTERQLYLYLNFLNNIHPNIKFTVEIESNNVINFLDLKIIRNTKSNGKINFEFEIYRKETYTDSTIPMDSFHPFSYKMSAFRSMLNRAYDLPLSKEKFDNEIETIKIIANNNGFNINIINKFIANYNKKRLLKIIYPITVMDKDPKYFSITYFGSISDKISNLLRKNGLNISLKSTSKLKDILFNQKDKIENLNKSGVYLLTCSCNEIYIGQTGRNFNIRFNEHLFSFMHNKNNSTFAKHLLTNNHFVNNINCLKILHFCEKGFKLDILEAIEIFKHLSKKFPLINEQLEIKSSILFNSLL